MTTSTLLKFPTAIKPTKIYRCPCGASFYGSSLDGDKIPNHYVLAENSRVSCKHAGKAIDR